MSWQVTTLVCVILVCFTALMIAFKDGSKGGNQ